MTRRDLVIVRAGDGSLHERWVGDPAKRSWDLVVSYFGDDPARFRDPDCVRIDGKGPKWPALQTLLRSHPDLVRRYEYVWLPDDDIDCGAQDIERLFAAARRYRLLLAQPALTPRSHLSWVVTLQNPFARIRFTNFVEIMVPCFERTFLTQVIPTMDQNLSGWGLDFIWPRLAIARGGRVAIIDSVTVTHTRPIGSANYALLEARGISAHEEWSALLAAHDIVDPVIRTETIELRGGIRLDARSSLGEAVMRAGYRWTIAEAYACAYPNRGELRRKLQATMRSPVEFRISTARRAPPRELANAREPAEEHRECQPH